MKYLTQKLIIPHTHLIDLIILSLQQVFQMHLYYIPILIIPYLWSFIPVDNDRLAYVFNIYSNTIVDLNDLSY